MDVADFDFTLPEERIADRPAEPRDAARLLVYDRATGRRRHARFRELGEFLAPGDLLVLNDTRVLPYRLLGRRATGGRVECLILERTGTECRGYVRPARKIRPDERIVLEDGRLTLVPGRALGGGELTFSLEAHGGSVDEALEAVGRAPLPPYIRRDGDEDPGPDRERYQTVYARTPGAVAAPTAGLHFTPGLLDELRRGGIETTCVTLHVGAGTFLPVRADRVEDHRMHAESYEIPGTAAEAVAAARDRGRRVVAVGTTAARTLETAATGKRRVRAGAGRSDIFLYPGVPFRVVDALITNFHLPRSTLLMLVAAFAGREEILALYREAVAEGYRFYSYGDAMLLL